MQNKCAQSIKGWCSLTVLNLGNFQGGDNMEDIMGLHMKVCV